jgi:hypothetical protein
MLLEKNRLARSSKRPGIPILKADTAFCFQKNKKLVQTLSKPCTAKE